MTKKAVLERQRGMSTPMPAYSGFPWWNVLIATPGRECKATERLQQLHVFAYLPTYVRRSPQRCRNTSRRLYPMISGMIFVPVEMMDVGRRDEIFELAGVKTWMRDDTPIRLKKVQIELLRELEARENMAPPNRNHPFKIGDKIKFADDLLAESWGHGAISALAKDGRIRVDIAKLFGRTTHVWVSAPEIVAI